MTPTTRSTLKQVDQRIAKLDTSLNRLVRRRKILITLKSGLQLLAEQEKKQQLAWLGAKGVTAWQVVKALAIYSGCFYAMYYLWTYCR